MTEQRASCGCTFDQGWQPTNICGGVWKDGLNKHIARAAVEIASRAAQPSVRSEQPMPIPHPGQPDITELLIEHLRARRAKGLETYGTNLTTFNGRDALQDALDEALDLSAYLTQAIAERAAQPSATMGAVSEEEIRAGYDAWSKTTPVRRASDGFPAGVRWREQHGGAVDWRGLLAELAEATRLLYGWQYGPRKDDPGPLHHRYMEARKAAMAALATSPASAEAAVDWREFGPTSWEEVERGYQYWAAEHTERRAHDGWMGCAKWFIDRWRERTRGGAVIKALAASTAGAEAGYPESYRCKDCGEHHYLDCSIPSEIWNQIADEGDSLCAKCIDKRLVAKGLTAKSRFYFVGEALSGESYPEASAEAGEDAMEPWVGPMGEVAQGVFPKGTALTDPPAPLDREAERLRAWLVAKTHYVPVEQHWGYVEGFNDAWALLAGRPAVPMVLRSGRCGCYLDSDGAHFCEDSMSWESSGPVLAVHMRAFHFMDALKLWPNPPDPAPDPLAVETMEAEWW